MKSNVIGRISAIARIELIKYFRQPMVIVFAVVFPGFWIIMNGLMYGNDPSSLFNGIGTIDYMLPAYSFLIILVTGLSSLPQTMAKNIETGVIRRYAYTPIKKHEFLLGIILGNIIASLLSLLVLFSIALIKYDVSVPTRISSILLFVITSVFISVGICSFGLIIANVVKGFQSALSVSLLIYFALLFLSGCSVPLEILPKGFQEVTAYIPFTHMVRLLQNIWLERNGKMGLYCGSTIICSLLFIVLSIKSFKWVKK